MTKSDGNVALSQDICSEVFMKAFENIETFSCGENASFSAWLYRIAYHSFIDALKKKDTDVSLDETLIVTEKLDYVDIFQKKEQTKEILQYLDTL
jgi:RNA polymerase sigma factor (sigma-70 family)